MSSNNSPHPPERSFIYMIPYKRLSLADIFTDCQNKFNHDKYQFLEILSQTIDLDEIVPMSFISHFHVSTGRPRKYYLYPILRALLLQRIFSIPTNKQASVVSCLILISKNPFLRITFLKIRLCRILSLLESGLRTRFAITYFYLVSIYT